MINNTVISQYTPDYRDECADVFQQVYRASPFNFDWLDKDKAAQYFKDLENMPGAFSYVLMDSGAVIGACLGQKEEHFQNAAYKINEFFIKPDHQHMGLGSYFVNELENKLREMGIKAMYLFTQHRMQSYMFYRSNNFIANEETVHMVRVIHPEPAVVYTRTFLNTEE